MWLGYYRISSIHAQQIRIEHTLTSLYICIISLVLMSSMIIDE